MQYFMQFIIHPIISDGAGAAPEKAAEPEEVEEKKDIKNIKKEPIDRDEKP